jgi:hypothetical protein
MGQFNVQIGQPNCVDCSEGRYNPNTGRERDCKDDCDAGFYITADKSTCSACSLGQYNNLAGQSMCKDDCNAGYFIGTNKQS